MINNESARCLNPLTEESNYVGVALVSKDQIQQQFNQLSIENEEDDVNSSTMKNMICIKDTNIPQSLIPVRIPKKYKKAIKKKKLKHILFGVKLILKNSILRDKSFEESFNQPFFQLIPSQTIFFLAGDILVEIQDNFKAGNISYTIFNEFRNILRVTQDNSSFNLRVESINPYKNINLVIYQLENSQDKDNYNYGQILKLHQNTIFTVSNLIQSTIDYYSNDPEKLQSLLLDRENFLLAKREKVIEQLAQNDEFALIGSLFLSFANKTTTVSHISLTRPAVALIGGEDEQLLQYFLQKGYFSFFNYASRRIIFGIQVKIQNMSLNRSPTQGNLVFEIPQIELCLLDNINIVCRCSITSIPIQYPPHLRFQGDNNQLLNQVESYFIVKFDLTSKHIETILQLRQDKRSMVARNIEDQLEVWNMEYEIKSQIFLEKYYKEYYDYLKMKKSKEQQQERIYNSEQQKPPCKYRFI